MDEPFNGHVRDATSQGHNDTWVNDDVSTSNTREVNEVKGQTGQSRQANDKSSKPSANKKSENSGAKTQPNAARDNISHVIETLADASVVSRTTMTQILPMVEGMMVNPLKVEVNARPRPTLVVKPPQIRPVSLVEVHTLLNPNGLTEKNAMRVL